MINVALIGYGYWGQKLLRVFTAMDIVCVRAIIDIDQAKLNKALESGYKGIRKNDLVDVLHDEIITAVIIATPALTHFGIAIKALSNNKHVLLEKPMTTSLHEATILGDLAFRKNLILMIDHTYLYTTAIRKVEDLILQGTTGNLKYVESVRMHPAIKESDVNVLWDLAPHDISIINFLTGLTPEHSSVKFNYMDPSQKGKEAVLNLIYPDGLSAIIDCSWLSSTKVRKMIFGFENLIIEYNELEEIEKLKVYEFEMQEGIEVFHATKMNLAYSVPALPTEEALSNMAVDFINSILINKHPVSSAAIGVEVVSVLNKALQGKVSDKNI